MAIRRNAPPRKRPAPRGGLGLGAAAAVAVEDAPAGAEDQVALAKERQALIQEFEDALREHADIDRGSVEFLTKEFGNALMQADIAPSLATPDPASLQQTLQLLNANGMLSDDDLHALTRQFNEMQSPLKDSGLRNALEFAQRLQQDGKEQALAWLAAQQQADATQQVANSNAKSAVPAGLGQSVTSSRSRRLRGPPRNV